MGSRKGTSDATQAIREISGHSEGGMDLINPAEGNPGTFIGANGNPFPRELELR